MLIDFTESGFDELEVGVDCNDLETIVLSLDDGSTIRLTQDQCAALLNALADNEALFRDAFEPEDGDDDGDGFGLKAGA